MPKFITAYESLDDVPEALRDYFVEHKDKDDKVLFIADFGDDVRTHPTVSALQNAHEAQKKANRDLKAENAELKKKVEGLPEDFDADEIEQLRETKRLYDELKEKGDGADPEKKAAHQKEVESMKKMHDQQLNRAKKQMDEAIAERDKNINDLKNTIKRMVVTDNLSRLLVEANVKKEGLPFAQAKLERSVEVIEEDGEFKAVVKTDMGEVPLEQFVPKWAQSDEAKIFVDQPKGGGAEGGARKGHSAGDANPWSKAGWDMKRQSDIVKVDAAKADRLAKQAGHKKALGALMMDAK